MFRIDVAKTMSVGFILICDYFDLYTQRVLYKFIVPSVRAFFRNVSFR